jgi:hypothetical protein
MIEDKLAILQEVIDRHGDCEGFAKPAICKRCPLGNKIVNGRKVNCMDYLKINTDEMTEDEIFDTYEKAAEEELFIRGLVFLQAFAGNVCSVA